MTPKSDGKTLVEQATEWLGGPLYAAPNRLEFLCFVILFGFAVWWFAQAWGWNEGMADGARLNAQARRDELESWHERQRRELREDVEAGVAMALDRRHAERTAHAVPRSHEGLGDA